MSTHLPIRAIQPLQRQCLLQRVECRSFSTTLARPRGATSKAKQRHIDPVQTAAAVRNQIRTGRASSVMHMEQLKDESNLPDDIGLLPGKYACWTGEPSMLTRDGRNLYSQANIPRRTLLCIHKAAHFFGHISNRSLPN